MLLNGISYMVCLILVFGESHQSHSLNRKTRTWFLNEVPLNEGDLLSTWV